MCFFLETVYVPHLDKGAALYTSHRNSSLSGNYVTKHRKARHTNPDPKQIVRRSFSKMTSLVANVDNPNPTTTNHGIKVKGIRRSGHTFLLQWREAKCPMGSGVMRLRWLGKSRLNFADFELLGFCGPTWMDRWRFDGSVLILSFVPHISAVHLAAAL